MLTARVYSADSVVFGDSPMSRGNEGASPFDCRRATNAMGVRGTLSSGPRALIGHDGDGSAGLGVSDPSQANGSPADHQSDAFRWDCATYAAVSLTHQIRSGRGDQADRTPRVCCVASTTSCSAAPDMSCA